MKNLDNILPTSDEGLYPIRTVSEVSGVNAITLRAWERRYGLFKPKRTPKGHRLYSENDILRIRKVLQLLDKGVAIGRVAKALKNEDSIDNLPELIAGGNTENNDGSLEASDDQWKVYHTQLITKVNAYDTAQLERLHHELFSLYPIEIVSRSLIRPALHELRGCAAQLKSLSGDYHFYRNFLQQRIGGLFLKNTIQNRGKKLLLMGVPDEQADIELMLFGMPLLTYGFQVISLGSEVCFDAIPMTLSRSESEGLILYVDSAENLDQSTITSIKAVVNSLDTPIFISGEFDEKQVEVFSNTGLMVLSGNAAAHIKLIDQTLSNNTD